MLQSIGDGDNNSIVDFCGPFFWGEGDPAFLLSIWFTRKTHFHLNGYVKNQFNVCMGQRKPTWNSEDIITSL
jgi:hypothetical protein